MFFDAMSIVFRFESEETRNKLLRLNEELGPCGLGTYLSNLVERDFQDEEEKESNEISADVQNTSNQLSTETPIKDKCESIEQVNADTINQLLSKVQELLDKGITVPNNTSPSYNVQQTSAGDLSVIDSIVSDIKEVPPVTSVIKKKSKSKLGGLKKNDINSILNKMNSMTK